MATQKVSKKILDQRKINNGDAINKRILEKGKALNSAKKDHAKKK